MSNCVRDSKQTRKHCLHWPIPDDSGVLDEPVVYCCRCSLDHRDERRVEHRE